MVALGKTYWRKLVRPRVLVQDRDGRVRRVTLRSRKQVIGRLRAWLVRLGVVERLPV